jgi:hypothetical protein
MKTHWISLPLCCAALLGMIPEPQLLQEHSSSAEAVEPAEILDEIEADDVEEEEEVDPLTVAYEGFLASSEQRQIEIVAEIERRIEQSEDPAIQRLLEMRERARGELKIVPREPMTFHDPQVYAPRQPSRRFVSEDSTTAVRMRNQFERYGAEPIYAGRIFYDFGLNHGVDHGTDLTADDRLWNYFFGYVPEADILVAWMVQRLDHCHELDAHSVHFSYAYSDLNGACSVEISLYDAFASLRQLAMPDVDVIAFARHILKDDSYISPIPQGTSRQRKLYDAVSKGFLQYFRHRTLVEYTANLLLNPEAPLDYAHETLRERILYCFHLDELDLDQIRVRLEACETRAGFVRQIDELTLTDDSWRWYARSIAASLNEVRWAIANVVYDVLREENLLRDTQES